METKGVRDRTDYELKRSETEPNGNQKEAKQNRMRTKVSRHRTEWKPSGGEAEPNANRSESKQN